MFFTGILGPNDGSLSGTPIRTGGGPHFFRRVSNYSNSTCRGPLNHMCGLTRFRTMLPLVVLELTWLSLGFPQRLNAAAAISGHRAMAHVRFARALRKRRMLRHLNPGGPKPFGSVAAVFFGWLL